MHRREISRRKFLDTTATSMGTALVPAMLAARATRGIAAPTTGTGDRPPKQLAFTVEEYRERVRKVQQEIAARKLDGLILTVPASVCYLTGYESLSMLGYFFTLVPRSGDPILLMADFESYNAWLFTWLEDALQIKYPIGADYVEETRRLLAKQGLADKKLGIELGPLSSITASEYVRLKAILPQATLVETSELVPWIRSIKSPAEIAYHREAARISSVAMQAAIATAQAGITDNDVAAVASERLVKEGSEYMCYQPIVTTGRRSGVPHSTFHRVPLRQGDHVFMEFGACVCRYSSPTMRVVMIGEPTPIRRSMAETCLRSVNTMAEKIRPGVAADTIAAECEKAMGPLPSSWLWHGYYGYSVGLGFPPEWGDCGNLNIMIGEKTVLRPGMVFHCSTSIREPGQFGTTFSETIVVTETGCEVLTKVPRHLFIRY